MITERDKKIFKLATKTFGINQQRMMAVGEIGEYLILHGKEVQGRATHGEWLDGIADIIIMMNRMAQLYDPEAIEKRIRFKISILENKLASHGVYI